MDQMKFRKIFALIILVLVIGLAETAEKQDSAAEIKRISGNGKITCKDGKHHQKGLYKVDIPDSKIVNCPTFNWGTKCNQGNGK